MGIEIERKFLVDGDSYRSMAYDSREIAQGYLCRDPERTVRVRLTDGRGKLTVKGITRGCVRAEYEYDIPEADARRLLEMCVGRVIRKTRWLVDYAGRVWEVDEFHEDLAPLTVAEVELPDERAEVELPPFVGREVTGDPAYYNSML